MNGIPMPPEPSRCPQTSAMQQGIPDTVSKRQQQGQQQQQQQQQPQPQNHNPFDDVFNDSLPVSIIPNCVNDSISVIYSATRLARNRLARWLDILFTCIIIYVFPRRFSPPDCMHKFGQFMVNLSLGPHISIVSQRSEKMAIKWDAENGNAEIPR